ncbi:MAG: cob(I)yrinic acid a,c-diamide adenosyltransferase [Alphaproteobacteria bacterium]|nr:cob(I)yrinic acid a,c-diamide adenosyltransferase [Alphaproteobacteria bacterium]
MVKLNKIYTRTGDQGETSLVNGHRVSKHSLRPSAFGSVDELNSVLGLCRLHTEALADADMDDMLSRIQNDLFDLGADLATPVSDTRAEGDLRITTTQVERLEAEIDRMNAELQPLNSFVLPGGVPAAAHIHLARAQARRTEREMTELATQEAVGEPAMQYINRLSDHLFVMARYINNKGDSDVLWKPGLNA